MRVPHLLAASVCLLSVVWFVGNDGRAQSAPAASSSAPKKTCPVNPAKPTEADTLLARRSYKEAETAYRAEMEKDGSSEEAHLGLVRALIGQDKVADAQAEAARMLKAKPTSAVAETAYAEAAFRAADVEAVFSHAKQGLLDDPCDARVAEALADFFELNGYFARSARLYEQAHRLRPNDELIRRDWIDSLPRKRREEELTKYLAGPTALSKEAANAYDTELTHLKARRPGECKVISRAETTKTRMQPVFGDRHQPEAYGLDVYFDGKRRRMQIDTGASGITLTASAARALNLQPEFRIKTGGVGDEGDLDSYLTHVKSIKIGDVEVSDCMVDVVKKSKLDVDGLIGMDVFRRWLVTLDYQNAEVRFAPLPPRPAAQAPTKLESDPMPGDVGDEEETPRDSYVADSMKDWLHVPRIGHEILLPSRVKSGPIHYLIMDTGAGVSNLSMAMARESGKLHGSPMEVTGLSGKVQKVYEIDPIPLQVENLMIPPEGYVVYDMTAISHSSGFETSGLLGLPTLQRLTITIDYRDNLLKLDYDPKHDVRIF